MIREKKINYTIYLIVGVFIILVCLAAYKAEKNHEEKLYLVVNKKIKESAMDCYLHNDCKEKISLKDLYDKDYLNKVIDPITKEDMDPNLCLEYINDIIEFC